MSFCNFFFFFLECTCETTGYLFVNTPQAKSGSIAYKIFVIIFLIVVGVIIHRRFYRRFVTE